MHTCMLPLQILTIDKKLIALRSTLMVLSSVEARECLPRAQITIA